MLLSSHAKHEYAGKQVKVCKNIWGVLCRITYFKVIEGKTKIFLNGKGTVISLFSRAGQVNRQPANYFTNTFETTSI